MCSVQKMLHNLKNYFCDLNVRLEEEASYWIGKENED
jgi:hypothetical protein